MKHACGVEDDLAAVKQKNRELEEELGVLRKLKMLVLKFLKVFEKKPPKIGEDLLGLLREIAALLRQKSGPEQPDKQIPSEDDIH
jgi:hypothetical protein